MFFSFLQLANTLRCLAGLIATLTVCALSFKPLMPKPVARPEEPKKSCVEQIVHVDNWRNKKYVIWALSVPSALFGYFVPFVHIVSKQLKKEQVWPFVVVVVQLIYILTQADMSCTTTALLFFFPLQEQVAQ